MIMGEWVGGCSRRLHFTRFRTAVSSSRASGGAELSTRACLLIPPGAAIAVEGRRVSEPKVGGEGRRGARDEERAKSAEVCAFQAQVEQVC